MLLSRHFDSSIFLTTLSSFLELVTLFHPLLRNIASRCCCMLACFCMFSFCLLLLLYASLLLHVFVLFVAVAVC